MTIRSFADIPADVTSISAETYRQIVGNATSANDLVPRLHSSQVNTEPKGKRDFAQWLRRVSPIEIVCEYQFHPERRWRADWCAPDAKLIFEYDGFTDHLTLKGMLRDSEKGNEAQLLGFLFLRVNAASCSDGSAYEMAKRAFRVRGLEVLS
jgi:hypothetical protein